MYCSGPSRRRRVENSIKSILNKYSLTPGLHWEIKLLNISDILMWHRQQCRIPCLGTPEDILRLLKAGYRERLAPTRWAVGLLLGKIPYIVPMVQAKQEAGGCTFFQDGLCELHAAGLKPTEGRLSHHTITMENLKFGMSLSWNVAKEWLDERNFDTIREIVRIMGK